MLISWAPAGAPISKRDVTPRQSKRRVIGDLVGIGHGTQAKKLIDESGLKVESAILLSEAAELVKKAVA